jgi:pimeloyl-ACP methyl ester carboxylesterase
MADLMANGIRFNVVTMGPGEATPTQRPTVVFIHGLIMDNLSSYYYTLAPGIARDADVVLYDLRGHGRSQRTKDRYSLDDAVDDIVAILDGLGVSDPAYLVGNSYGGTIALAAAIRRPDRVAGLVLIEAIPIMAGWGERIIDRLDQLVMDFDQPGVRDWIDGSPRKIRRMAATCEELITASTLPEELRHAPQMTSEQLSAITCPVLGLYGELSDVLAEADVLASTLPSCRMVRLDGCSHSALMEAPEELESEIRTWLAEVAPEYR